ncbi:MAG: aminodeoxychorismate/anthranilate synthase component II [marine benthic group bacterium]|nr:aminodeoxychorismate/anthranilate synthase component II [Gemmatimonadota bacterium]MCL7937681.1 aminodeoxychorismate/anthranilate synthase component II [Gemmatimonadota bacterium]
MNDRRRSESTPHALVLDNYDSFTWNLVQALACLGAEVTVRRNDELSVEDALDLGATHVVVSPGPGRPEQAGVSVPLIAAAAKRVPVLGVCLGHQALAAAFGGRVAGAGSLMHGKSSHVYHDGQGVYEGLPNPFPAGRYHSLAVQEESLPPGFRISSYTSDGEIMGIRHRELPLEGVQFHPESILTPEGDRLLRNFLQASPPGRNS